MKQSCVQQHSTLAICLTEFYKRDFLAVPDSDIIKGLPTDTYINMPSELDLEWLESLDLKGPAANFAEFSAAELRRLSNSEADFDPETYIEAIKLVLRKLGALDMEGMQ